MDRIKTAWAWFQRSRLWKAWKRYGDARGNLLAGGVTYFAFFSIFPAVALAFTVFGFLLQDNPQWLDEIKDYLNQTLPGFIQDGGTEGLIPLSIPSGDTLTVTGLIGLGGLLFAGLGWLGALRDGIRAIFGVTGEPGNLVTNKLRDLGVLVILGVAIVVSAAVTGIAGAATSWVAERIGLGGQAWLLSLIAFVIGAALDGVVVLVMLRLLSGVDVPRRGLIGGAVVGGVGLTLLKVLGATLIAGTTSNPLFASIALVVGLLAWLNLMSRVVLLAAAWSANSLVPDAIADLTEGQLTKLAEGPEPAGTARSAARKVTPASNAATRHTDRVVAPAAKRADDRVNLALGAALGASAAVGLGVARKALRRITAGRSLK
jgi:membrane protein